MQVYRSIILAILFVFASASSVFAAPTKSIDFYDSGHPSWTVQMYNGGRTMISETFPGDGKKLYSFKIYANKFTGAPTGNATITIYNIQGTYGSGASPTGSPIATSDPLDVTTWTGGLSQREFLFSGGNAITLNSGTYYAFVINYNGGNIDNCININIGNTYAGDYNYYISSWSSGAYDIDFELWSEVPPTPTPTPTPTVAPTPTPSPSGDPTAIMTTFDGPTNTGIHDGLYMIYVIGIFVLFYVGLKTAILIYKR